MMNIESNFGNLFQQVAKNNFNRDAIIYKEQSISYGELEKLASCISQKLENIVASKQELIVIFSDKTVMGYATMLACLMKGYIYTNLDPDAPLERTKKILLGCKPALVVFDFQPNNEILQLLNKLKIRNLKLLDKNAINTKRKIEPQRIEVVSSDIAYVMFTSGSTGEPKGVAISHRSILNFIKWSTSYFELTNNDIFTQINPLYFDNSVFDFFSALSNGSAIVPITKSQTQNPHGLVRYIEKYNCTIWFGVPSIFVYLQKTKSFEGRRLENLRTIIFGGEGFPKRTLKQLYDQYSNSICFVNVYGPTEVTCICSAYLVRDNDFSEMNKLLPLGEIIENVDFQILTKKKLHRDENIMGELLLTGQNLAVKYFNNSTLTKEKFIEENGTLMYRTGDLVLLRENQLHFLGRNDYQIKRMGYRIELQEIEFIMNGIKDVLESAAVFKKRETEFGKIILFFSANKKLNTNELFDMLKENMPSYMRPDVLIQLDEIPKNSNGKIDRGKLKTIYKSSPN